MNGRDSGRGPDMGLDHEENRAIATRSIKDFYFTLLRLRRNQEKLEGQAEKNVRTNPGNSKQYENAVAGIKAELGIDVTSTDGLNQVKEIVVKQLQQEIRNSKVGDKERRAAKRALATIVGVPLFSGENKGNRYSSDEAIRTKRIGLANLAHRGDPVAFVQMLRERYDLNEKEAGFIRSVVDKNRIVPLIDSVLKGGEDAAQAKEILKGIYGIKAVGEELEVIREQRIVDAMYADDELEKIFGIEGVAELFKKIGIIE